MNYHSHERRSEVWTVISSTGSVVIDGVERVVAAGDVIDLPVTHSQSFRFRASDYRSPDG